MLISRKYIKILPLFVLLTISMYHHELLADDANDESGTETTETANELADNNHTVVEVTESIQMAMNLYTLIANELYRRPVMSDGMILAYKKQRTGQNAKKVRKLELPFDGEVIDRIIRFFKQAKKYPLNGMDSEFEKAVDSMMDGLEDFRPLLGEYQKYTDEKKYLEDGGAFLNENDAEFLRKAENLKAANLEFTQAFRKLSELYDANYLDYLKKHGFDREATIQKLYASFSEYIYLSQNMDLKDTERVLKLDAELGAIKSQIDALSKAISTDVHSERYQTIEQGFSELFAKISELKNKKYSAKIHQELVISFNRFVSSTLYDMDF